MRYAALTVCALLMLSLCAYAENAENLDTSRWSDCFECAETEGKKAYALMQEAMQFDATREEGPDHVRYIFQNVWPQLEEYVQDSLILKMAESEYCLYGGRKEYIFIEFGGEVMASSFCKDGLMVIRRKKKP